MPVMKRLITPLLFELEDSRQYYVCQHYVRMNMGINRTALAKYRHQGIQGSITLQMEGLIARKASKRIRLQRSHRKK